MKITPSSKKKLGNPIEELYLNKNQDGQKVSISYELFNADEDNIDLRTEVNDKQIWALLTMKEDNRILQKHGLKPVYRRIIEKFSRLQVSRGRGGRKEFVEINKENLGESDVVGTMEKVGNLTKK